MRTNRMPRSERRQQLLDTATQTFAKHGYHPTSMDMVAEGAGVSKPVLYQHFASKQDLYYAIIDSAANDLLTVLEEALRSTDNNRTRVEATMSTYFTFVAEHREKFILLFESDSYEPQVLARLQEFRERTAEGVAEVIEKHTSLTPVESSLAGQAVTGMAEHIARRIVSEEDAPDVATSVRIVSLLAWSGVSRLPDSSTERTPAG